MAPAAAVDPVTAPAGALVVGDTAFLLPGFGLLGAGLPGFAGALGGTPDDGRGVEGGVRSGEWQGEGAPQAAASMGAGAAAPTASRAVATAPPRTETSQVKAKVNTVPRLTPVGSTDRCREVYWPVPGFFSLPP